MKIQIQPLSWYQEIARRNRMNRVPMRLLVDIMPWRRGDVAGYAPDIARNLHGNGEAEVFLPEGQDAPAVVDTGHFASTAPEDEAEIARLNAIELSPAILAEDKLPQIAMAKRIKGVEPKTKMSAEEATAIITAELKRREEAENAGAGGLTSQNAGQTIPRVPGA